MGVLIIQPYHADIALVEAGDINMDCPHTKHSVSWFAIHVANVRTTTAVHSWKNHPLSGGC